MEVFSFSSIQNLLLLVISGLVLVNGQTCQPGTYLSNGVCTDCLPGTYAYAPGSTACISCSFGTYNPSPAQSSCIDCPLGKFVSTFAQTTCIDCSPGTFANETALISCFACDVGSYNPFPAQSSCELCQAGKIVSAFGQIACYDCPPGTYSAVSGATITNQNVYANSSYYYGDSVCHPCNAGSFQPSFGQSTCSVCPVSTNGTSCSGSAGSCAPGQYYSNNVCLSCGPGSFNNNTGATACISCAAGSYQFVAQQSSCLPCPPGTFSNTTGSQFCLSCPTAGIYNSPHGQTSCLNQYTNGISSATITCPIGSIPSSNGTCQTCVAGTYVTAGSTTCNYCPLGTYQPFNGQTSCFPCSSGKYSNQTGSVQCSPCNIQQYQFYPGSSSCSQCLSNNYPGAYDCIVSAGSQTTPQSVIYVGKTFGFRGSASSKITCVNIDSALQSAVLPFSSSIVQCINVTTTVMVAQSLPMHLLSNTVYYVELELNDTSTAINTDLNSLTSLLTNPSSSLVNSFAVNASFTVDTSYTPTVGSTFVATGSGDPHFTGFDGSEFDFMGTAYAVYNLYSADDILINAHFRPASQPSHYPQYTNPMWMDSITVIYGGHVFGFDIYDHLYRPTIDQQHMIPLGENNRRSSVSLMNNDNKDDENENKVPTISAVLLTDPEQYMDINIKTTCRSSPSTGIIGQTRHPPSIKELLNHYKSNSSTSTTSDSDSDSDSDVAEKDKDILTVNVEMSNSGGGGGDLTGPVTSTSSISLSDNSNISHLLSKYWLDRLESPIYGDEFKLRDGNLVSNDFERTLFKGKLPQ